MHGITGNHKLLVGADEGGLHLGILRGDDGIFSEGHIGLVIHLEAEVGEILQHAAAQAAVVFSDTTGEDNEVYAVHGSHI